MRLAFILSFLNLLLFGANLNAQVKVTGKVTNSVGAPVFATVQTTQGEAIQRIFTNEDGTYALNLQPGLTQFVFSADTSQVVLTVRIPDQPTWEMQTARFGTELGQVIITHDRGPEIASLPMIDMQKAGVIVEKIIIYGTVGASSNNELTSNYNVRGGNYDENLVYVNGFLINRPFLTRSGQQEGLSFINTALVENIYFSAGGFQANYGDKLSSVLDIVYKRPDSDTLQASATASLLGVETHIGQGIGSRFRYLLGARYRSNGYLLNSLPTKGNYNPVFWDAQLLTEFDITEKWKWSILGHISSNNYQFAPETQETDFGTANEAYSFNIYFDGQEDTRFLTATTGTSLKYSGKKYSATTFLTMFKTDEREYFDIQGQYYINQLETDPSKEAYGDSIAVLGIGTFLNHARNRLQATIINAYHDASWDITKNDRFRWGMGVEYDQFQDVLSEWRMIDSAGYSLPQMGSGSVDLFETIKGRLSLKNTKAHVFSQYRHQWQTDSLTFYLVDSVLVERNGKKVMEAVHDTIKNVSKWDVEIGLRGLYTSFNDEAMVTPRASLNFVPARYVFHDGRFIRRAMRFRLSSGLYYQPPFYREFRTFTGGLNPEVRAQKSFHLVAGGDYSFYMWERDRPFKVTAEAYYKYLWDINPYEIDNVRTRYYADNIAKGYATGFDVNLHGEFVPGLQSFFKLGILSTKEDVLNDSYTNYYNASGERIIKGYSEDQVVVDSIVVHPGGIRRPTDQRLTGAILFQDKMPGFEQFSAQMGLIYGSRLPYGPPDYSRYKDTLTMKAYFRVDMGLSYDFLYKRHLAEEKSARNGEVLSGKRSARLQDAIISFEIFNLLGINNVMSKQWIQDVEGKYYSIPNYLTQRRFNLKLIVRI